MTKLPPEISAGILAANKKETPAPAPERPPVTVSQAKEWADIGTNLATAVGATAHALSMEANDFVKTPVGW